MNIQSLVSKIDLFKNLVIDSGLKRDIDGYISSIAPQQNQENLSLFKDISVDIEIKLSKIYESDLPESLMDLFPNMNPAPFTSVDHLNTIRELIDDTELPTPQYFSKLNSFLGELKNHIILNDKKLDSLRTIFEVYVVSEQDDINENHEAIISLIFKDNKTVTSLKDFSKALNRWNRTLHIYHQLITSNIPEEIELVEIQNGSIDVVVNIDVNVVTDFVELVRLGFEVYGGYLLYKSKASDIVKTYFGNKVLLKLEEKREKEMLENISLSIKEKLLEQHKRAIVNDKEIEKTSIDTKITDITNVLSEHIIKGNDIKLLAAPNENEELMENAEEIRGKSIQNRKLLRDLPEEDRTKLLERYSEQDESADI